MTHAELYELLIAEAATGTSELLEDGASRVIAQWVRDAAPDWPGDEPFQLFVGSIVSAQVGDDWTLGYGSDPRRGGADLDGGRGAGEVDPPRWRPGYGRYERDFPRRRDALWEQQLTPRILHRGLGGSGVSEGGGVSLGTGGVRGGAGVIRVERAGAGRDDRGQQVIEQQVTPGSGTGADGGVGDNDTPMAAVFLPFADRLAGLVETQMRGLAQFARRPASRDERLSTNIFAARPEVLALLGGESRVSETFRQRLLEHPAPTPAGSVLAWMGWLPVDSAVVRDRREVPQFLLDPVPRVKYDLPTDYGFLYDDLYPPSYLEGRALDFARGLSELKRQAGREQDIRLLSDARRDKLDWPQAAEAQVLQAPTAARGRGAAVADPQRRRPAVHGLPPRGRRPAEHRGPLDYRKPRRPARPPAAADATLHEKLLLRRDAASDATRGDRDATPPAAATSRGAFRGGYRIQSLVPSADAVRYNASSGVPIAVPPYLEQSPAPACGIEAEWVGWSWDAGD